MHIAADYAKYVLPWILPSMVAGLKLSMTIVSPSLRVSVVREIFTVPRELSLTLETWPTAVLPFISAQNELEGTVDLSPESSPRKMGARALSVAMSILEYSFPRIRKKNEVNVELVGSEP